MSSQASQVNPSKTCLIPNPLVSSPTSLGNNTSLAGPDPSCIPGYCTIISLKRDGFDASYAMKLSTVWLDSADVDPLVYTCCSQDGHRTVGVRLLDHIRSVCSFIQLARTID